MHCNSTPSEALIRTADKNRTNGRYNCCENNEAVKKLTRGFTAHPKISTTLMAYRLAFLLAFSYLLLSPQLCHGIEDAASSFQRPPPPPPPGSSYTTPAARMTNEYGEENRFDEYAPRGQQGMSPPPPPPPPSNENLGPESQQSPQQYGQSSFSPPEQQQQKSSLPIHYEFPMADGDSMDGRGEDRRRGPRDDDDDRDMPSATSSARKDLVTQYWSSKKGKVQIQTVIAFVGYGVGNFVSKVRS